MPRTIDPPPVVVPPAPAAPPRRTARHQANAIRAGDQVLSSMGTSVKSGGEKILPINDSGA